MTKVEQKLRNHWYLIVIMLIGTLITLPQLNHQATIIGADGLFHFNRFYDVAMQIKNHNFSYFMQLYGFLNSGRIVTAVYSPLITYIFGLILLLCNSFYKFEIFTRFAFFILSGLSMKYALKMAQIKNQFMIQLVCVVYAFSPAVIRWDASQNFTSIGAMLIPLVAGCGMRMINNQAKPINWVQLGVIMAIVVQTHLATAMQSILLLTVYAAMALIENPEGRKELLKNGIYAALLCTILSLNVVAGMLELYRGNYIIPIVQFNFADGHGIYHLTQIFSGQWVNLFFVLIVFTTLICFFRKLSLAMRVTGLLSLTLFLVATGIFIDWPAVMDAVPLLRIVLQFPARLVAPAAVLSLITVASIGDFPMAMGFLKLLRCGLTYLLIFFLLVNMRSNFRYNRSASSNVLESERTTIPRVKQTSALAEHVTMLMKRPLNHEDIEYLTKSTSDYMPSNQLMDNAAYGEYQNKIILPSKSGDFQKQVGYHKIIVTWKSNGGDVNIPVAYYRNTRFKLNGSSLVPRVAEGIIKVPRIKSHTGKNILEVTYQPDKISTVFLKSAITSWVLLLGGAILGLIKKLRTQFKK